jgi:speckle-type POZ protein
MGFLKRKKLESSYLKNDSFQVKCDLTAVQDTVNEPRPTPLLDLQRHLGALLESKVGGDVTFEVDGEMFTAHRYVLCTVVRLHGGAFWSDESEIHGSHMYPWH